MITRLCVLATLLTLIAMTDASGQSRDPLATARHLVAVLNTRDSTEPPPRHALPAQVQTNLDEQMAHIYATELTPEEMGAILRFWESPAGRAFRRAQRKYMESVRPDSLMSVRPDTTDSQRH